MNNQVFIKNFTAESAISQYRVVKFGSSDSQIAQASAPATDVLLGVCIQPGGAVAGERCDVAMSEAAEVEYGGTVTRGDLLTTDASGRAVKAAPAAGVINNIIGIAAEDGIVGQIGSVMLGRFQIKG